MPGMMDTILNLGLNDQTVLALATATQERAFRLGLLPPLHPDVRRRGDGRAKARRARTMSRLKRSSTSFKHEQYHSGHRGHEADAADLKELVTRFKALVKERTGQGISRATRGSS